MIRLDSNAAPLTVRIDPDNLAYIPDRRIRTPAAAAKAIDIAEWATAPRRSPDAPTEQALFEALHTCAFRARRALAKSKRMTAERRDWTRRWVTLREYLVERNLGLAYSTIARFRSPDVDDDDLRSDALFALVRAVDRFNPRKGFRFSTYACIAIERALVNRRRRAGNHRRLFPVSHDVTFEQVDRLDAGADLYVERLQRALNQNLGDLTALESRILAQRFPPEARARLTLKEIGDATGLSKERIRQIQNNALRKLRDVLDADPALQ